MKETVERTEAGAILYDQSILNHIPDSRFAANGWQTAEPVKAPLRAAGRGDTMFVSEGTREFVLKHYLRGGLIGRFIRDRYLWIGEARNRAFVEWRLLARLVEMGLPVPRPAAARYRRRGLWYTADLLTVREPGIQSLSVRIVRQPDADLWRRIGEGIRRFHEAGVCHADLNAYNVQLDARDALFLLDFDRGAIRAPGAWRDKNLARLHRSLRKLKRLNPALHFDERDWAELLDGYAGGR